MINNKHLTDLKFVIEHMIDEISAIQFAMNRAEVGPEQIRDFYAALDFAEHRVSGIMYGANIEIDGVYNEDD